MAAFGRFSYSLRYSPLSTPYRCCIHGLVYSSCMSRERIVCILPGVRCTDTIGEISLGAPSGQQVFVEGRLDVWKTSRCRVFRFPRTSVVEAAIVPLRLGFKHTTRINLCATLPDQRITLEERRASYRM